MEFWNQKRLALNDERLIKAFGSDCRVVDGTLTFQGFLFRPEAPSGFPAGGNQTQEIFALACRKREFEPVRGTQIETRGRRFVVSTYQGRTYEPYGQAGVVIKVFLTEVKGANIE